ncbi:helix-turn-helix domain-containing protein [Pseudonocardia nematodicida]|uniref:Helix-turn-helix domain-containing protein n=1 Tax=Pseudonocardia nematodicida TaxID=1206997 RepID=A0ABV1KJN3_9PSEU
MLILTDGRPAHGRVVVGDDLGIRTIRITGGACTVERPSRLIRGDEAPQLHLMLTLDGRIDIEQGDAGAQVGGGGLAWYASTESYRAHAPGEFDLLHVLLPGSVGPLIRDVLGPPSTALPAQEASTRLVASLMRGIVAAQAVSVGGPAPGTLEAALLGLLGALPRRAQRPRDDPREALFDTAVRYIHDHLGETDLSPARIAAAVPVSVRYLHLLFAEREMSVAGYVREERLLGAARDLADPAHAHRKVGEIGRARGFVSAAHFNRSFARRFGRTPGRHRESGGGPALPRAG